MAIFQSKIVEIEKENNSIMAIAKILQTLNDTLKAREDTYEGIRNSFHLK